MITRKFLKYQEFGNGPAVVLLHDTLLTPESWDYQIRPLLQEGFRVIVPNLSGIAGQGSVSAYSAAAITLLNRLGIGRFALCGLGMGGSIALDMLERYRQRISCACFINTRASTDDIHEKVKRAQVLSAMADADDVLIREELLDSVMGGREERFKESVRLKLRQAVYDYTKSGLLYNLQAMQERKNYMSLLETLDLPVLLVSGADDLICHAGYGEIMAKRLPNCVENFSLSGGHLLQIEKAEAVNSKLIKFLLSIAPQCRKGQPLCSLRAA